MDERYPEGARGDGVIEGLDALESLTDVHVFHAGTARDGDRWRVRGGRAAYVTAVADDAADARARAYEAIATLSGTGWRCRHDIAAALVGAERGAGGGD